MLLPFSLWGKWHPAKVSLIDGSEKIGFVELPDMDDSSLKFRLEKKGDTERISIDDIAYFETHEGKELFKYTTMKLTNIDLLDTSRYIVRRNKAFVLVVASGTINIYAASFHYSVSMSGTDFYIQKPNEDFATAFTSQKNAGTLVIGAFADIKRMINLIFKTDCPKFGSAIAKDRFKKDEFQYIVGLYDEVCGNKKAK